jgi:heme-binding NEAT domain protein
VAVDADISVADPDSTTLQGATVQISSNFVQAEDELSFTDLENGITGSYDDGTGTLTLSGSASVADYQATLRSVTYENSSENPSTDTRTVTFQVDDGATSNNQSDPATRDVEIARVNDAPVVTTSGTPASYIGSGPATAIDPALTVGDVDDTNLEGAEVRISSGSADGDALVYTDQLDISGDYDSDTGVLTLSGSAPVADYETALRSVGYSHEEGNAAGSRTVEFTVNDGDLPSGAASADVSVNDPPVLTTTGTALSYLAGDGAVAIDPGLTVSDADSTTLQGATVHITANGAPEDKLAFVDQPGITSFFDEETGVLSLSGSASVSDYQTALRSVTYENTSASPITDTRTVTFQVDDGATGNNQSEQATRDIEITVPPPPG